MYTVYVYDSLTKSGTLVMPSVDIIPGHSPNIPVRIHISDGMGSLPATTLALLNAALLGVMAHFLVFRPLRNAAPLGKVVGALGVTIYLQGVALYNFGAAARQPRLPEEQLHNFLNFLDLGEPRLMLWPARSLGGALWSPHRTPASASPPGLRRATRRGRCCSGTRRPARLHQLDLRLGGGRHGRLVVGPVSAP